MQYEKELHKTAQSVKNTLQLFASADTTLTQNTHFHWTLMGPSIWVELELTGLTQFKITSPLRNASLICLFKRRTPFPAIRNAIFAVSGVRLQEPPSPPPHRSKPASTQFDAAA